jgi:glycosyltransferase involved in cell wall biosynthesis
LKTIKSIFEDKINYFSPISANNISDAIENFLKNNELNKNIDYKDILEIYNEENTSKQLAEILK